MSIKKWILSIVAVVVISIFIPGPYEKMENAYQQSLWTYDFYKTPSGEKSWYSSRYFSIQRKEYGYIGIETWSRFRFGFPFRATTIDSNSERFIVQGKIQIDFIMLNVIFNFFIFIIGFFVFVIYKRVRGK